MFDVGVMIVFGVLGYGLRKLRYELAPFILALVLGPMFEQALRQSLIISRGDPLIFFTRPISAGLLVLAAGSLAWVLRGRMKAKQAKPESGQ